MKSHKDLDVWKRSMELVTQIYEVTREWPREEAFGLTAQIRRAAISVPSNIAEGAGRSSNADFSRFLSIAMGSLSEIETQLEIAQRLAYAGDCAGMIQSLQPIRSMLVGLKKRLQS
jgi:four helix bundle protein